jgi:hypothetical protein
VPGHWAGFARPPDGGLNGGTANGPPGSGFPRGLGVPPTGPQKWWDRSQPPLALGRPLRGLNGHGAPRGQQAGEPAPQVRAQARPLPARRRGRRAVVCVGRLRRTANRCGAGRARAVARGKTRRTAESRYSLGCTALTPRVPRPLLAFCSEAPSSRESPDGLRAARDGLSGRLWILTTDNCALQQIHFRMRNSGPQARKT